jgi:hypothetical protein
MTLFWYTLKDFDLAITKHITPLANYSQPSNFAKLARKKKYWSLWNQKFCRRP